MTYNFLLTDGTPLVDLLPLESDGYVNRSVPRQVLDVDFGPGTNSFVVADDVTARFAAGFTFDVVNGPFLGPYIVAGAGSSYDSVLNLTTIPVTTAIVAQPVNIVDVTTGLNGVWEIEGPLNGDCVFYPGASFTVAGNSDGPSNGAYTVQSSVVSGSYSIFSVASGPGGVGTTWTLIGDETDFFNVGTPFKVSGGSNPGAGSYTTLSVALVGANTEVTVNESITGTANTTGVATISPAITRITVTGTIPGTAAADGTASTPPSIADTFYAAPTMLTNIAPNTWSIIWHVSAVTATKYVPGCPVLIKGNNIFPSMVMTIVSAVQNGGDADVTVTFKYVGTPTAPNATGAFVYPVAPIPYGYIQYTILPAATSLELVGRGSPAYNNSITWGQSLQDNDIHILENFANTTPPVAPLTGQMWYDTGTAAMFYFASTIYDVVGVSFAPDVWTIDGGDFTATFIAGVKFTVHSNMGIDGEYPTYPASMVFEVASSFFNGSETEITITATPDLSPPFTNVATAIPAEATTDGLLYVMTDWHQMATINDIQQLDVKQNVRLTTTAADGAIDLTSAPASFDSVVAVVGDRILIKYGSTANPGAPVVDGTDSIDNGIYVFDGVGNPMVRSADADGTPAGEVSAGMFMWVTEGVIHADQGWLLITDDPITLGVTPLTFALYATAPVSVPISSLTQADKNNSIDNADWEQVWNWELTNDPQIGLTVGETAASTGGISNQVLVSLGTAAGSTAKPLRVQLDTDITPQTIAAFGASTFIDGYDNVAGPGGNVSFTAGTGSTTGGYVYLITGDGGAGVGGDIQLIAGSGGTVT
ncbi:MAG: hypothetical protein E4H14_03620, partial [Candidatus Thorarchaeota archaeon]